MSEVTRRRLLVAALGAAAGAVLAWLHGLVLGPEKGAASPIAEILKRRLEYLDLEPDGVASFAEHYAREVHPQPGPELEDDVVVRFLLSSDFFWNGADESRAVRFTRYHDPYAAACANPFALLG